MNTGETIALIKAFGNGGSSLPSVTSSDNGKVLAVEDGAWAADSNLFVAEFSGSPLTCDKTYQEVVDAVNAGRTVIGVRGTDVYAYSCKDIVHVNFTKISGNSLAVSRIALSNSDTAKAAGASLAPSTTSFDDGCELIVKGGAWVKQQKKFVVTLTPTAPDYSGTMDKTVAEINAAYEAGRKIVFRILTGQDAYVEAVVTFVTVYGGTNYPMFEAFATMTERFIGIFNEVTQDGTSTAYLTEIYALTPAT